jgi:hypothetical protein
VFTRKNTRNEAHQLDESIKLLISELAGFDAGTPEHDACVTALKTLMELRIADKAAVKPSVSPDVLVSAVSSLLGIVMILGFEKANVLTTKALAFVPKPRV